MEASVAEDRVGTAIADTLYGERDGGGTIRRETPARQEISGRSGRPSDKKMADTMKDTAAEDGDEPMEVVEGAAVISAGSREQSHNAGNDNVGNKEAGETREAR